MNVAFETRDLAVRAARLTGCRPDTIEETEYGFCLAISLPGSAKEVRQNVLRALRAFGCKPRILSDTPTLETGSFE